MRRIFSGLFLALVVAIFAVPALALAAPVAASPPMPNAFTVLTTAAAAGSWVLWHWQGLGALLSLLVGAYAAVRLHQWEALQTLAGEIILNVATLAGYDDAGKLTAAVDKLYSKANPVMKKLFSQAQFEQAVKMAFQLITKPKATGA